MKNNKVTTLGTTAMAKANILFSGTDDASHVDSCLTEFMRVVNTMQSVNNRVNTAELSHALGLTKPVSDYWAGKTPSIAEASSAEPSSPQLSSDIKSG